MKWKARLDNAMIIIPAGKQITLNNQIYTEKEYFYQLEPHAQLIYFFMPVQCSQKMHIKFQLAADSSVTFFAIIPHLVHEINLEFFLQGKNARAFVRGIYAFNGDEKIKIQTMQEHITANTQSDLSFKGVLAGKSSADFEGMINIGALADFSNARQQNKHMLLSPHARANSKPQLQIKTNEVQCAHGSAVGHLDEQQLFYMNARGIAYQHAKQLLIRSFFADILDELPADMVPTIQKKIENISREL